MQIGKYQHYKNEKIYEVVGIALHSETQEEMVIYKALYHCEQFDSNQHWVRPKMFLELVDHNGHQIPRFKFLEETSLG
jgi:hypothetical protein